MSRNIAILLTICLVSLRAESRPQDNAKTVLQHNLRASVVSVISYGIDGSILAHGVGFFVSERGDVLTRGSLIAPEAVRTEIKTLDNVVYHDQLSPS